MIPGPVHPGMRIHRSISLVLSSALAVLTLGAGISYAQVQPGDIFREHVWAPQAPDKFARVTGTDATAQGAFAFLPNPVHQINIPDLTGAVRAEVMIEKLTSHAGTRLPRMRVNSSSWISIPEPAANVIPGTRGTGLPVSEYLQMTYPVIPVPLANLQTGMNSFEFDCQGANGSAIGLTWPQWLHYGVVFRVYYGENKVGAPTGEIVTPRDGDIVGDDPIFDVSARASSGDSVVRVDLLGDYDDFDWQGNGTETGWRAIYRYGRLERHMASDFSAPWQPRWQNSWIPTQHEHFRVIARITASNGLVRITEPVRLAMLRSKTVHRYRSSNISRHWQTNRQLVHGNDVYVTGDLNKATAAQFVVSTWNATSLDEVRFNGPKLMGPFGRGYDLSYDIFPLDVRSIVAGKNRFETYATTPGHGCEVQWPGFELFVRYDVPETPAVFIPYGSACAGSNGVPALSSQGTPKLTQSYQALLANGKANTPVILLNGFSKDLWLGRGLPFDWAPLGAPGCALATSIDFVLGLGTNALGTTAQTFVVPNRTEFLGGSLFAQFMIFDPSANSLGFTLSDAGRWLFGQ